MIAVPKNSLRYAEPLSFIATPSVPGETRGTQTCCSNTR
jgi:hypothetical protein